MKRRLSERYKNLSLFSKISMIICFLALALSMIILITSVLYYQYSSSERLLSNAKAATRKAADTLDVNYQNIMERFTTICGTTEFVSDIKTISAEKSTYHLINTQRLVQNELSDLASCNYLVHSAMLLSGDGSTAYTLYNNSMRGSIADLFPKDELASVAGVTFLPQRVSPFRSSISVIPLLIPLTINSAQLSQVDLSGAAPDAYVVLLIDSTKLAESLALNQVNRWENHYFLISASGALLNTPPERPLPPVLTQPRVQELIQALTDGRRSNALYSGSDSYVLAIQLRQSKQVLVNYVPRETLQNLFGSTGAILLFVALMVIFVLIIFSILMTSYVTRPINRLVDIVRQIQNGTYQTKQDFATSDEIGQLCRAINQMYDTIQLQMRRIKQEESEKYRTEIKLLTEQINPHFLYNTLECIQSKVIRGESETASSMIQYLADYLRIGLSGGADLIPVFHELRHANAYVKLMNQRFGQSIMFMYHVTPDLSQRPILKTILQPLVENSIKHGFGIDAPGIPVSVPTIEVQLRSQSGYMIIEVSDNGSGFDTSAAEAIMYGSDPAQKYRHVGLHNVYHRLITYYGKEQVSVTLSSIPYYRNTITIRIPLEDAKIMEKAT